MSCHTQFILHLVFATLSILAVIW